MKVTKTIPKVLGAIAVLIFGPLLGILIAVVLAAFALRPDPNFVANGGHAAPGDGILVTLYVFISLIASIPLSIWGAVVILFRPSTETKLKQPVSAEPSVAG